MSSDKSGSPACGIYVRIDDFSNMLDVIGYVRQMAFAINRSSGYEKNMCVVELVCDANEEGRQERIADLIPIVQEQGLVAIISGFLDSFDRMGADGIFVTHIDDVLSERDVFKEDAIIGSDYRNFIMASNPDSVGVDYVIMNADPSLITEFSSKYETPCVARGKGLTNDNCGALAQAGADFVDVSDYIFGYEKGVMQATVNVLYAFGLAVQAPDRVN